MNKINNLMNQIFPKFNFEIGGPIKDNFNISYTYVSLIQGDNLKVSFSENALQKASILLACAYVDDQEIIKLTEDIEYMKAQIQLINKEEFAINAKAALKEDGIEITQNCTVDIIIGNGTKIKHILPF